MSSTHPEWLRKNAETILTSEDSNEVALLAIEVAEGMKELATVLEAAESYIAQVVPEPAQTGLRKILGIPLPTYWRKT